MLRVEILKTRELHVELPRLHLAAAATHLQDRSHGPKERLEPLGPLRPGQAAAIENDALDHASLQAYTTSLLVDLLARQP
jgi:hypothetical protein